MLSHLRLIINTIFVTETISTPWHIRFNQHYELFQCVNYKIQLAQAEYNVERENPEPGPETKSKEIWKTWELLDGYNFQHLKLDTWNSYHNNIAVTMVNILNQIVFMPVTKLEICVLCVWKFISVTCTTNYFLRVWTMNYGIVTEYFQFEWVILSCKFCSFCYFMWLPQVLYFWPEFCLT